ncbi:hypothetical protein O181_014673 [Austropuccinia psidii MF-1]|uniref:Uncharacterized protein n=1 Tax=Austropuccinia psidii MF-1 TaxID=1389203 RepID=A0A9Q3C1P4_9BASI|nr:hypothetical protein [Austropuccinia psidii MF-1]
MLLRVVFWRINLGLMLCQNMALQGKTVKSQGKIEDCDELYAALPLVHKEKITGCQHPYASKARTGHSSSLRERIVDDEDKNMSQTKSKTNGEPRRDNFTTHKEGTQEISEFTHAQMPIAQSMLDQSEMRQKRD